MRQGRQITRGTDRTLAGNHGRQALVVQGQERVDDFFAHAGEAARQAGGLEQQDQPHHRFRHRLADADRVRSQQLELQDGQVIPGNARGGQLAEAGVDAIDRRIALGRFAHQFGACSHAGTAGRSQLDDDALAAAQAPQLRERQLAGDDDFFSRHAHPNIGSLSLFSRADATAIS